VFNVYAFKQIIISCLKEFCYSALRNRSLLARPRRKTEGTASARGDTLPVYTGDRYGLGVLLWRQLTHSSNTPVIYLWKIHLYWYYTDGSD